MLGGTQVLNAPAGSQAAINAANAAILPAGGSVTGRTFWVDGGTPFEGNNTAANSLYNGTQENPFSTIDYAIGQCVANRGDVIMVKPGHTEAVIGAAGIALDVAGVTIRGIGSGSKQPTVALGTAIGASVDVTAANCTITGLKITGVGFDAITAMVNISGANCRIANCEIVHADATNQAVLAILTTAAADGLLIEDCYIHGTADAGTATAVRIVGGAGATIRRNRFRGAYTAALGAIQNVTTAAVDMDVLDNTIANLTASGTSVALVAEATTTGMVAGNRVFVNASDASTTLPNLSGAIAAMGVAGNSVSSAVAQASVLI